MPYLNHLLPLLYSVRYVLPYVSLYISKFILYVLLLNVNVNFVIIYSYISLVLTHPFYYILSYPPPFR